ncbi:MAG: undecaprenyl/decaprenyl-phosphate alpha-N-acetylglucosaminyl 1-phosphate transferase [Deltaproteobacteria bacterium]|nr:undecaprenyl/decaprenyl-phosphate alpha-N-acetylglucosaminyl 1-phosphate transferase [Deltaproteobacteria bacterium]
MKTALASLVLGFLVALWLTPIVRRMALRLNLLDRPEDARRVNLTAIPRIGGLAIAAAVLAPLIGLALYKNQISAEMYRDGRNLVAMLAGALGALVVGLIDDLLRPPAKYRLLALVGIAIVSWQGGHRLDHIEVPYIGVFELGYWSLPATVLWIVTVIVAFNFIDGLDGLAAGVAFISTTTMFVFAYLEHNLLWMTWTGAMSGALLGFLVFNSHPASIFMGDSGSNFLGYLMAVVAMQSARKQSAAVAMLLPMLAMGLPLLDAGLTMIRRAILRQGLFVSEKGHLHHRLLDLGLTQRRAVLILYGVSVLLSLGGIAFLVRLPMVHFGAAVGITVAVFGLMFAAGYLRPRDLLEMYRRGLLNREAQRLLETTCDEAVASHGRGAGDGDSLRRALGSVVAGGGVSGISYRAPDGAEIVAGDYNESEKGLRATVENGTAASGVIRVFWKGRTNGVSPRELAALRRLRDCLAGIPRPDDSTPPPPRSAEESESQ